MGQGCVDRLQHPFLDQLWIYECGPKLTYGEVYTPKVYIVMGRRNSVSLSNSYSNTQTAVSSSERLRLSANVLMRW